MDISRPFAEACSKLALPDAVNTQVCLKEPIRLRLFEAARPEIPMKPTSIVLMLFATLPCAHAASQQDVLAYHGTADRGGNFVMPGLTWEKAKSVHADENFRARFQGHMYAQPLYVRVRASQRGRQHAGGCDRRQRCSRARRPDWRRDLDALTRPERGALDASLRQHQPARRDRHARD
jgi:hypothetical protein